MKYALDFHSFARVFWMIFFFKKKKILTSALYNLLLNCFKSYPILNSFGCILLDLPASYLVASQPNKSPFGKYWMRELEATKKKYFPAPSQSLHYPRRAASNTYTCILGKSFDAVRNLKFVHPFGISIPRKIMVGAFSAMR